MSDETKASKAKPAQAEPELETEAQGEDLVHEEIAMHAPAGDESRTGYAEKGLRAGDECVCPDGRKGVVQAFDAGLICIPKHDQGE